MGPIMCLDWCLEMDGHAADYVTSMHVLEWLADRASEIAMTESEHAAVEWARGMASAVVGPYLRTGESPFEFLEGYE